MNPTSNFSSYRSTLKAAMWRSTGNNVQQQCLVIPFFSLLIKDIYFLNEGCANRYYFSYFFPVHSLFRDRFSRTSLQLFQFFRLPNGHINFEKFWQLAHQISEFIEWKRTVCPFPKDLHIITFLQASPVLSEKGKNIEIILLMYKCILKINSFPFLVIVNVSMS